MRFNYFCFLIFFLFVNQIARAENVIRILSLDGGGMRGIIEAMILKEMEHELKKPISEIFDIVAGTSAGGMIALGLTVPGAKGGPKYTAAQVLSVFTNFGSSVFDASVCHKIKSLGGLIGPKYEKDGITNLTQYFLADTLLSEAIIPTLVTGYDVESEMGVEFCSVSAKEYPHDLDCLMREVAQATSAAPSYFPLTEVNYSWGKLEHLADGALYKTNPALLAYLLARKLHPDHTVEIYSIGTGKINAHTHHKDLKSGGLFHWMVPIIHHLQNSDTESDHDFLHRLLNEDGNEHYFRLNVPMENYNYSMDDTSSNHIALLYDKGQEAVEMPLFKEMIKRLRG